MRMEKASWLTPIIPLGGPTLVFGEGGTLKSAFCQHVVALVTQGLCEGELAGIPSNVIYFSREISSGRLAAKLGASGADLERVSVIGPEESFSVTSNRDLSDLKTLVKQLGASLVVFDPLVDYLGGGKTNKHEVVSKAMGRLEEFAQDSDVGVLCVHHARKSSKNLQDAFLGSVAFRDRSRAVLGFVKDRSNGRFYFQILKNNEGVEQATYLLETGLRKPPGHEELPEEYVVTAYTGMSSADLNAIQARNVYDNNGFDPDDANDVGVQIVKLLQAHDGIMYRSRVMEHFSEKRVNSNRVNRARAILEKQKIVGVMRVPCFQSPTAWYLTENFPNATDVLEAVKNMAGL